MRKRLWMWTMAGLTALAWSDPGSGAINRGSRPITPFDIKIWQTEDGLPQNSVIAMTQARDGYLWLGTLNGLVRFDGLHFTVFDENNTLGLNSSRIVKLLEDHDGNLWIGTETAGVALAQKNGRVRSLEIGRGSRDGRVLSACEDAGGAVWLFTADGQLCRHRDGRIDIFHPDGARLSRARLLIPDESGGILVGTDQLLVSIGPTAGLDPKALPVNWRLPLVALDYVLASQRGGYWRLADGRVQRWIGTRLEQDLGPYPWPSVGVTVACEDAQGHLLVGTSGAGVFWFEENGTSHRLSTEEGLSHNFILSLWTDREGSWWVGTDGGGLNRVRRHIFDVLEPSQNLVAQSACADRRGGVWVGYNGGGVDHWRGETNSHYGSDQPIRNLPVRSILVDHRERVWVGLSGGFGAGVFQFSTGRVDQLAVAQLFNHDVFAIFEDHQDRLWFGTGTGLHVWNGNEWRAFTTRDGLSADNVRAIAEESDDVLWIGTRGGGLNRFQDGKFSAVHKADGLSSEDISSLYVDPQKTLWVGTDGGGLLCFRAGRWTHFSKRDGLVSNNVGYVVEDDSGFLWIGSNAGLMRVPKKALYEYADGRNPSLPIRAYGTRDGLPSGECSVGSQPNVARTADGKLWFPTIKGLAYVDPKTLQPNTNAPPVIIESVLLEGQPTDIPHVHAPLLDTITIPAGREHLEIHYTSLNLAAPERARFKYRLAGSQSDWIDVGDTRVVSFFKLPAGGYRFQVAACNEDGLWNEAGATLALTILPPFWRTWWFYGVSTVCILTGIIAVVRYFSVQKLQRELAVFRQQELLEKERARIARDIHDQVGASLTQVALLGELVQSDKDLPAEVETHARQICQTARETTHSLDEIVWTVNPANDTLEGLINYICKNAQEYLSVAGLRYRLEVPADLPATPIPPEVRHNVFLAAKEAVTNIVRHARASSAWIRLQLHPSHFILEIADDGRGLAGMDSARAATRNGLRNMRKRMEDVGGECSMDPAPEGGLRVRLTVPLALH